MSYKTLFRFPLQLVVVGRSKSGKSYLLRNRIIPNIIGSYDAVIVYSPSALTDSGWQSLAKKYKKVTLVPEINDKDIASFIHEIGVKKAEGKKTKFLFIFDDITTYLSASNSSFFATLATRARHFNISYIITTHKYKALNPLLRNNAQHQIFFKVTTSLELNSIADEIATVETSPNTIKKMLNVCTGSHKAFLVSKGAEDDEYFCLLANGLVKHVYPIEEAVEEYEEESGLKFLKEDYKLLQMVQKLGATENIIFV